MGVELLARLARKNKLDKAVWCLMIISISGWERQFKTGLAAVLATHPGELDTDFQKYDIKQGFGNLHLYKTGYPWHYCTSDELKAELRKMSAEGITNTLYFVDEADNVFPARDYGDQEQKAILKKMTQHGKLGNIIIYTFQQGDPEDPLLGVDKILRSLTRVFVVIDNFDPDRWYLTYTIRNYLRNTKPHKGIIRNLDKYLGYWNHLEPVVD